LFSSNHLTSKIGKQFPDMLKNLHLENSLDKDYQQDFETIMTGIYKSRVISSNLKSLQFFIFALLAIMVFCFANLDTSCLSYIMEISINDNCIYWNYYIFWTAKTLSFLLSYTLLQIFASIGMTYALLIGGFSQIIILILFWIYAFESPRINFEYSNYTELTDFFNHNVPNDNLNKLYINPNLVNNSQAGLLAELERNRQFHRINLFSEIWNKMMCYGTKANSTRIKKQINKYDFAYVTRSELIRNPFIMYNILLFDKHLRKNFLILLSFTFNISIIHFIVASHWNQYYITNRLDLYNFYFINQYQIYLCVCICLSNYFFYLFIKFFGYIRIMVISFIIIFIFSIILSARNLFKSEVEDLNRYTFHSSKYENDEIGRGLTYFYYLIIIFFTNGLYFCLVFYILQFTKTISRCLLLGVCKCLSNLAGIISNMILNNFENSFFFVALASITGFIHCYFLYTDFDFSKITDFRKIELENNEEN